MTHYLKRTINNMLAYRKSNSLGIIGYFDSNFVGCSDSKCFTLGYIYMMVGEYIKHTLVVSSTLTIKFVACYEASNHGFGL
ncbi:hypothetical protein CR513_57257, partial [Mucuna pruriens]